MSDVVLRSGGAELAVALLGAEARRWRCGGVDVLWPGDPEIWPEISPLLFPVVGWTRDGARVGGRQYALGLHGFARRLTFSVEREGGDFARFIAHDDEATRAVYPFSFELAVEHRISEREWRVAVEARNLGEAPMPYACGLHPGFRFAPGSPARVRFDLPERAEVPVIAPGGLIGAARRPLPLQDGTVLPIDDALFAKDALCFLDLASPSLRFERGDGTAIEMERGDFRHVGLWRRPGAPFLCLEAWTGHSDPEGFAGDLFEKPSMLVLAPRAGVRHEAAFRFRPA